MAIDVVPAEVSDMNIEQLVKECTERDGDRWQAEGDAVAVVFDGYYRTLDWGGFDTCAEPAFRNHLYAGVCSSLEEITRSKGTLDFSHGYGRDGDSEINSFNILWVNKQNRREWLEFGDNRAEAALRAFVAFLRAVA